MKGTFADYQAGTALTAVYPGQGTGLGLMYCGLKLAGESGEVAENIGKAVRDDGLMLLDLGTSTFVPQPVSMERRAKLAKELGDVLWYISQAATELGLSLDEIAEGNLAKLADRQARGVLKGSGDDR
jgi:NTP pyrophosphatase (non-canonical NTP hydrolase)